MTARAHIRGHEIAFERETWVYADTHEDIDSAEERSCSRCGKYPTPEGYDACLGKIPGAKYACCGHGIGEAYVIMYATKDEARIPPGPYCYYGDTLCPYWDRREDMPEQMNGYCSFLEVGDWEGPGLGMLWDQCKECGVNLDEENDGDDEQDTKNE